MANRPRDLADQMAGQHNLNDGSLHETFTLSVEAARLKAREIIYQIPHGGYMTIVSALAATARRTDRVRNVPPANGGLSTRRGDESRRLYV
jgi:hypothetical protein